MDEVPSGAPSGYGQFCPVSMASEVLCTRWTMLLLREFHCGSTRFSDLRRGVPRMSPTLLSKRLAELEAAGILRRRALEGAGSDYVLTEAGEDLRPVVMAMGNWGTRWIESTLSLRNLDPSLLMWDMRRHLDAGALPPGRSTIQFLYPELPEANRTWWLVVDEGAVDLCRIDPGFEVNLFVEGPLRSMTAIWMGVTTVAEELAARRLVLDGDPGLAGSMHRWLGLSPFAKEKRRVG